MAFPDIWGEGTALVDISYASAAGQAGVNFSSILTGFTPDLGDKPVESVHMIRGAKLVKFMPEEDTTLEFEGYPTNLNTASTDIFQRFFSSANLTVSSNTWDTVQALQTYNNLLARNNYRVTIMWTKVSSASTAVSVVPSTVMSGGEALRVVYKNARLISVKPDFKDNELKVAFKFFVPSHSKNSTVGGSFETGGTSTINNIMWQSSDGTTTLAALGNYVSAQI